MNRPLECDTCTTTAIVIIMPIVWNVRRKATLCNFFAVEAVRIVPTTAPSVRDIPARTYPAGAPPAIYAPAAAAAAAHAAKLMAVPCAFSGAKPSIHVSIGAKITCALMPVRPPIKDVIAPTTNTMNDLMPDTFSCLRGGMDCLAAPLLTLRFGTYDITRTPHLLSNVSSYLNQNNAYSSPLDARQRDPLNEVPLREEKQNQNGQHHKC